MEKDRMLEEREDSRLLRLEENGLKIIFEIRKNGVVELRQFSPAGAPDVEEDRSTAVSEWGGETYSPVVEVQVTGRSCRGMSGGKHNCGGASLDFRYEGHEIRENEKGKELILLTGTEYGLRAEYHMQLFRDIPAVQVWTVLENGGETEQGLEYVSSFFYQGLGGDSEGLYPRKMWIYTPLNSWDSEAQWKKERPAQVGLGSMLVDGFNTPGFGNNRYSYGSKSSWSSSSYLPMGLCEDQKAGEVYFFQIEHSGQWLAEYGSNPGKKLYLYLGGATENEQGWWKNLRPGERFVSVPVCFGVAKGDVSAAVGALTRYRRAIRRLSRDDDRCTVVFNDYMNCLMGDPTEENEKPIIDRAAELGCEYYCLDCGWYDKGLWWNRVGEWRESPERFPHGLKAVCDYVKSKGMEMGLWLEIEVMGTACPLAAELPDDWFILRHGKRHIDRDRYLLDFRNPAVRSYCMEVIDRLIKDYGVNYFKIDYNVTMGYGSDWASDSCADAIREHYLCLYEWYQEIFRKYPELVIENCGSGGQRMDYGMLKLLSLQSTSDQTDCLYNSYIAANVASAVAPEQAGMWVYPYEDEEEHVAYNMVNGLLLRPYISGMVWKLQESSMRLLQEGIALYKEIREDVKNGLPFFPLGFSGSTSPVLAYGVRCEDRAYLSVFFPGGTEGVIPLDLGGPVKEVRLLYPAKRPCSYSCGEGGLSVQVPEAGTARFFEILL